MSNDTNDSKEAHDYSARIEEITSDRKKFDETVYTSLEDAITELPKRWADGKLKELLAKEYFTKGLPPPLRDSPKLVLFRHVVTPNYELKRFLNIQEISGIRPALFEYLDDIFVPSNPLKYFLGKFTIYNGIGKKGGIKVIYKNIIDFNNSNGKKIRDIKTISGQDLVEFHHGLFHQAFPNLGSYIYDASNWFHYYGDHAKKYYKNLTALFVQNSILFENFVLKDEELDFTKEIFLPAFFDVWEKTGKKPLIVALEPTNKEDEDIWSYYPASSKANVTKKVIISPYQSTFAFLRAMLPF